MSWHDDNDELATMTALLACENFFLRTSPTEASHTFVTTIATLTLQPILSTGFG